MIVIPMYDIILLEKIMKNKEEKDILNISKDIKTFNGRENVKPILEYFNNPQDKLKTIHIAGTNGKGSVSNFINNILIENGFKVGLFTSPAIYEANDRLKINNINITDDDLLNYYKEIVDISEKLGIELHEFDIATIMAFLYFYRNKCDFAIIEVGIGGKIDSTNIIKKPILSIICKIGIDHINIFGNNIEDIAREKAGIIKEYSNTIIYEQPENIMNILKETALNKKNNIIIPDFSNVEIKENSLNSISYIYKNMDIEIKMTNKIQVYNSILALEAAIYLKDLGYKLEEKNILKGMINTKMAGRFQKINDNPLVILDGAHNVESVKALNDTLKEDFPNEKFVFITGFFEDKEYMKLVEIVAPLSYAFIVCELDDDRSVKGFELANFIGLFSDRVEFGGSIKDCLNIALREYSDRKIVIFGSLSLIKDSLDYFN